jgi:hypothetical protein
MSWPVRFLGAMYPALVRAGFWVGLEKTGLFLADTGCMRAVF